MSLSALTSYLSTICGLISPFSSVREQRVVDHVAVVAGDVRGGPDRVDDLEVRVHHRLERDLRARSLQGAANTAAAARSAATRAFDMRMGRSPVGGTEAARCLPGGAQGCQAELAGPDCAANGARRGHFAVRLHPPRQFRIEPVAQAVAQHVDGEVIRASAAPGNRMMHGAIGKKAGLRPSCCPSSESRAACRRRGRRGSPRSASRRRKRMSPARSARARSSAAHDGSRIQWQPRAGRDRRLDIGLLAHGEHHARARGAPRAGSRGP